MKKVTVGALLISAVALAVVAVPVVQAAPLLSQVNQAMRDAGIAITRLNQLGWGEGVVVGHYRSYQHLVDAMTWHQQQGRAIPDSSKFAAVATSAGKVLGAATGKTKCMNKVRVNSLSKKAISVEYAKGKFRTIRLTTKQYDTAIGRSVQRDATVKVCSKDNFKTLVGNVIGIAGLANTADGGAGGGGGDSGGGT